jgi:hypothetical protein
MPGQSKERHPNRMGHESVAKRRTGPAVPPPLPERTKPTRASRPERGRSDRRSTKRSGVFVVGGALLAGFLLAAAIFGGLSKPRAADANSVEVSAASVNEAGAASTSANTLQDEPTPAANTASSPDEEAEAEKPTVEPAPAPVTLVELSRLLGPSLVTVEATTRIARSRRS